MVRNAKLKKLLPLLDRSILKKQGNDGKFSPLPCDSAGGAPAPVLLYSSSLKRNKAYKS